jgi:hypothetical protein
MPTKRRRHAITETPAVAAALDDLRAEPGPDRVELGELVVLGDGEGPTARADRARTAAARLPAVPPRGRLLSARRPGSRRSRRRPAHAERFTLTAAVENRALDVHYDADHDRILAHTGLTFDSARLAPLDSL